jgi:hypothetical protein
MALIHPALHSHLEHHQLNADCRAGYFPAIVDEEQAHECPICGFLATSQLNVTVLDLIVAHDEAVCYILSTNKAFLAKICPSLTEPRAPPVITSL